MESIIGHRIYSNGAGVLRGQPPNYPAKKLTQVPPPLTPGGLSAGLMHYFFSLWSTQLSTTFLLVSLVSFPNCTNTRHLFHVCIAYREIMLLSFSGGIWNWSKCSQWSWFLVPSGHQGVFSCPSLVFIPSSSCCWLHHLWLPKHCGGSSSFLTRYWQENHGWEKKSNIKWWWCSIRYSYLYPQVSSWRYSVGLRRSVGSFYHIFHCR